MELPQPNVLLIPYPAQGHITPLMHLAKRLASLGVPCTLVTIQHLADRISQAHSSPLPPLVRLLGVPDGLPPDYQLDFLGPDLDFAFTHHGEPAVLNLIRTLALDNQPPFTCIIGDFFASWTRSLCDKVGLPEVVFWPQCAATYAVYFHVDEMISTSYNPFESHVRGFGPKQPMDLVSCIPGLPPVHPADLPFETLFLKDALVWLRNLIEKRFSRIGEAIGVLGNSFEELETDVCKALGQSLSLIGPLIPSAFLTEENSKDISSGTSLWEEADCCQWLDNQPVSSVIYLSFGSLTKYSVAQIQELSLGLAASQQRFLWVIRKDILVEKCVDVFEALPKGFLDETKDTGKIIHWAPQSLVLSHPAVGGFFSHCGWNSTLESISTGVPILGWPFILDQIFNCWLVSTQWKIGLELQRDENNYAEKGEVERAVRLLMEGQRAEEMRSRAGKMRDAARRAVRKDGGKSHENLKQFVNGVLMNHHI